ncbi:MAG: hypothetical protein LUH15_06980 [Tannerellaceae bacterium]|nr:hypothetical protein [Tannerellaceae bacterium]
MNKEGLILFVFAVCTFFPVSIAAQQPPIMGQPTPRIIKYSTPRSAGPAFRPDPNSPITKLRYKAPAPVTFTLHEKIIVDGMPFPDHPDYDDCFERLHLETDGVFFGEMITQQEAPEQIKLFFNIAQLSTMSDIKAKGDNVLKLIHFEPVPEEQRLSTIPLLLIYEDDPITGTNEQLVQKYMKDGKLLVDKALNDEILSQLKNYRLVHYNIRFREE